MNTNPCPFLFDEKEYLGLCREFIENRCQIRTKKTRNEYRIVLQSFRRWMITNEIMELNEKVIKSWMLDHVQKVTVMTVSTRTIMLTHFIDYLVSHKLWHENPFSTLRLQHHVRGYRGIARILKKTGSVAALNDLADIPFSGALAFHFTDYLNHVSALGKSFQTQRWFLKSFERYLRQHNINSLEQINASVVAAWNDWLGQASEYQERCRLVVLKGFFDFLLGQERILVPPIPQIPPHRRKSLPPYIFSRKEIRDILAAIEKLPDHRLMPYRGTTYRMVSLFMYTLGLRISEALNLKLADIDFIQDSVTIRDTKFYKGRVLPFGPRFKAALQRYINGHPLLCNAAAIDFLFYCIGNYINS